jgi:hypothetical protein
MGSSPSTATLVGEAVSGCSSGAELAAWDREGVGASPTSQTNESSGRNSAAEYVALNHVGAGASPAARTATDRSSAAELAAVTAMALVQVQPPSRTNHPGVTQQHWMWLLTTFGWLAQIQPPGPRPTVAQQQSKWLLPTRALVQVQLVGLFDLKLSGCSSGGERLLGMQEAAGAIPVIQT